MENKNPNTLTQKVIDFCKNPNEMIFELAKHSSLITGRNALAKIPLTKTLTGIILVRTDEFESMAWGGASHLNNIGFFSSHTEKLYFTPSFEHSISWYFNPAEGEGEFPIEYEKKPTVKMLEALGRALTEQLKSTIKPQAFDLEDLASINWAAAPFFDKTPVSAVLDANDMTSYNCSDFVSEVLHNVDYEQFLIDPNAWVAQAQKKIMGHAYGKLELSRILRRKMEMKGILDAVAQSEGHCWHKIKRLLEAIQGKKSVLVRLENVEFKMYTEGLDKLNGVYSSYYIHPDDRYKVLATNNRCSYYEFGIRDIKQVLYRGKVIYQNSA